MPTDELPLLRRRVDERSAQRFLEAAGRRAALLGNELGEFECWIWPLKICHGLSVAVRERDGRANPLRAVEVRVRPDATAVQHEGDGVRVRHTMFAPLDERAVVVVFEVECERELVLDVRFTPDFRPQWPAGLGGQLAHVDDATGCVVLGEELGRFAAFLGSPQAERVTLDADHALPREPVTLSIALAPGADDAASIPFVIAGAEVEPRALSSRAQVGEEDAALGHARSHEVFAKARELYRRALAQWPQWLEDVRSHWREFLARTTHFESDHARHAEAFLWAKIAIEKAWVDVDGLGRGLVAGLAPSRGGERPGFGWFFDGDALVASRAMSGYGDFEGARRVFELAASHQRADGKMMHELVLSARLCDWLREYPYAYYKAINTPGFVASLSHHLSWSGDGELRERMYPHAVAAMKRCGGDLDADGLLANTKAGIAAVEAGPLVGRIRAEIFLQGIWIAAVRTIEVLAKSRGDVGTEDEARHLHERAVRAFESFWSADHGRYGFAHLVDGERCDDLTAFQALPMSRGCGEPERALATAACLNRPALASDWGVRFFATDSSVYAATNYNTGSVFPYANNHAILALYRHGLATAAWQLLASQIALHGFSGLGFVPEHLRGDVCETPARGVPHQIFSSAAIVQSTLFGMLGLIAGAEARTLIVAPSLPPSSDRVAVRGLRVGSSRVDVEIVRERGDGRTRLRARFALTDGPPLRVDFQPVVPLLSQSVDLHAFGSSLQPRGRTLELHSEGELAVDLRAGPELVVDTTPAPLGAESSKLRVCETRRDGDAVVWTVWGLAGRSYRVGWRSDVEVAWHGARPLGERELAIDFDGGHGFVAREIRARAVS